MFKTSVYYLAYFWRVGNPGAPLISSSSSVCLKVTVKLLAGAAQAWPNCGWRIRFQTHLCVCQQDSDAQPLHRPPVCPGDLASGFPQSRWWREVMREAVIFYKLISEVAYHHFCLILSVTQPKPGALWEGPPPGCEWREAGILLSRLGGWVPHWFCSDKAFIPLM